MSNKRTRNEYDHAAEAAQLHIETEDLPAKKAQVAELMARQKLLKPYTDGLPYNRDRVIAAAKQDLSEATDKIISVGKRLIWVQAEESVQPVAQSFDQILVSHFPELSRRSAYNFMRLAKCSVDDPYFYESVKHKSKQIALLEALPDEEIQELASGGIVAGITLDEVDRTPKRDLMDKLRKYQRDKDRGQMQLREAEDKIKDLEGKIKDLQNPKLFDSKEDELISVINDLGMRFEVMLVDIKSRIPYEKTELPQSALRKLYYLLLYIQKETLDERLRLADYYDAAEEIPWEPTSDDLPSDDKTLRANVSHLEPVIKKQAEKARTK